MRWRAAPGFAAARDGHLLDAEGFELGVDFGLPVAPIRGDRLGGSTKAGLDPGDSRREHRSVGRVALHYYMVDDDTVHVVDDLGFEAELHRNAEAAFSDRSGVAVM